MGAFLLLLKVMTMISELNEWSRYWESEGQSGEVFCDRRGSPNQTLSSYWISVFNQFMPLDTIVDVACGAGSIYRSVDVKNYQDLHAIDGSESALSILKRDFPNVNVHSQNITEGELSVKNILHAVSQYGVEYGGVEAFDTVARSVVAGGTLNVISHCEDSVIQCHQQAQIDGVKLIQHYDFFSKAAECVKYIFANDSENVMPAVKRFKEIEPYIADFSTQHSNTICAHMHKSLKTLMENVSKYSEQDIKNWLSSASKQCDDVVGRASSVRDASLTGRKIKNIADILQKYNFKEVKISPFKDSSSNQLLGVEINAVKRK